MLSRLFIIGFLLCLPIAIALFSQQITRTVAPPQLPTAEQQVKLLSAPRNGRNGAALGKEQGGEVTEGYTLRTIRHWGEAIEGDEPQVQSSLLPDSQASAPALEQANAQTGRSSAALSSPASGAASAQASTHSGKAARAGRNKR